MISRRQLLYFSFLAPFFYPIANLKYFAKADDKNNGDRYPLTSDIEWTHKRKNSIYISMIR